MERTLLQYIFKDGNYSPSLKFIGLFTSDPNDGDNSGSFTGEVSFNNTSYLRFPITDSDFWEEYGDGTGYPVGVNCLRSTKEITFPIATSDWGKITHIGIIEGNQDSNLAVTLICSSEVNLTKTIYAGDQLVIPQGTLIIKLD